MEILFVYVLLVSYLTLVQSEEIDRKLLCESCLTAAKEIEKALQDAPIKNRKTVIKKLMQGAVCYKLPEDKRSPCLHLFGLHQDEFRQALSGKDSKQLDILLCYEHSTACVGVKLQSFKDQRSTTLESDIEALLRENKDKVRFVKPIHSAGNKESSSDHRESCFGGDWIHASSSGPGWGQSVILFHGKPILPPQLTAELRQTMCNYREQAVQLEVQRQSQQRNRLIARVQDLLDQTQTKTCGIIEKAQSGKSPAISGYTLVTDSPGLTKDSGCDFLTASFSNTSTASFKTEEEAEKARTQEQSEDEEEDEDEDISLDSLLKKSREYVKQEQKVMHTAPSDISPLETTNSSPVIGFSLRHSPVGHLKTQNQPLHDPTHQHPASLSPILPDQHIHIPHKDFCPSRCAQKRRPRPISTGNIHFSFPIELADLIPRSPGRSAEGSADRDIFFGSAKSSHHRASLGQDFIDNFQFSQWNTNTAIEPCSPNDVLCSPNGHPGASQFRRRCHTLDSQLQSGHSAAECIDRSQERVPRFMAGVTWLGPNRRLPTVPINQSYNIESPSTSKTNLTPDSPKTFRNAPEAQTRAENTQRQAQALEDRQRHLENEHALHMSSCWLSKREKNSVSSWSTTKPRGD
ncbi:hypothetical protein WMY93_003693 [Mugilogobius chulae]|uniref:Saposin B-type domain-containing protein n=1 Tax=Mugilogobius chulae TaxID=88201 RepID=A0AAW0Q0K6_9GOBI